MRVQHGLAFLGCGFRLGYIVAQLLGAVGKGLDPVLIGGDLIADRNVDLSLINDRLDRHLAVQAELQGIPADDRNAVRQRELQRIAEIDLCPVERRRCRRAGLQLQFFDCRVVVLVRRRNVERLREIEPVAQDKTARTRRDVIALVALIQDHPLGRTAAPADLRLHLVALRLDQVHGIARVHNVIDIVEPHGIDHRIVRCLLQIHIRRHVQRRRRERPVHIAVLVEGDAAAVVLERDLAVRAGRLLVCTAGRFHARQRLIVRFDGCAVVFVSVNRQRAHLCVRAVDGGIGPRVNGIIVDFGI